MRILRLLPILIAALLLAGQEVRDAGAPLAHATTPGENGKIAYEFDSGISVITPGTTGGTPLVALGRQPAWSPDGRKLAYIEDSQTLVVIDQAGTGRMDFLLSGVTTPSWSPDGNRIVVGSALDLFTVEVGQTSLFNLTNITNTPTIAEQQPEWGALGTRIAFLETGLGGRRLGILTLANSSRAYVSGAEGLGELTWAPDETKFAFTRSSGFSINSETQPQGGSVEIYSIPASGGSATALTNQNGVENFAPTWSPDGTKIAYVEDAAVVQEKIRTMNANGSGKTDVTIGFSPAWQPIRPTIAGVEFTQGIQELQTVFELQSDLAGDNMPPVPIVAGKPAAMRIYFGEVATPESFTVEVDGRQHSLTLLPGCKPDQRQKQENSCKSFDYFFTPPTGTWAMHVVVRDFANDVVFDETFTVTSIETDSLILKSISVCDLKDPGILGRWYCQDPALLMPIVSTLRKTLPTTSVNVALPGDQIRHNVADFASENDWWTQVLTDLQSMYGINDRFLASLGVETVYYGMVRHPLQEFSASVLGSRVAASQSFDVSFGYDSIQGDVMHVVGRALGLPYNNTVTPLLSGNTGCRVRVPEITSSWPYSDNLLRSGSPPGEVEVGFDVFVGKAVDGEKVFDMMGYCFSPGPNTAWLSPFNTNKLLDPIGPLAAGSTIPQAIPASAPADFWLVTGTLDDQAADVGPIWTLELDLSVDAGTGTHRIEIVDGSDDVLFTRNFTPGDASPGANTFSELIPVQPGAARLRILSDTEDVLADFPLNGDAPAVDSITLPQSFSGVQPLTWSVSDPDGSGHTYWVDYSPDGGETWVKLAMNLQDAGLAVDFDTLAASDGQGIFRVIATDGVNSGEATSAPFTVGKKLPHAEIIGPTETSFHAGQLVMLEAAAWDVDDGSLDGAGVTWSSDKDGALGSGANLPVYGLTIGAHTLTMTAQDSDANLVTDTIAIAVTNAPLVEGGINPGDTNCSGAADAGDPLIIAAELAGLDSGACQPLGEGDPMFGDTDCSAALGPGDIVAALRFAADLTADLPPGCKPYGV